MNPVDGSNDSVHSANPPQPPSPVVLHVSRVNALLGGMLWAALAAVLGAATRAAYHDLVFPPPGQVNRLVDLSIAILALPLPLGGLFGVVAACRWSLLGAWPGDVGVFASAGELVLRLGPFGTKRYKAVELTIAYPFELVEEESDGGVEAHLPIEQQLDSLLPRITHPTAGAPINQMILKFVSMDESAIASELYPVIAMWRSEENAANE